LTKLCTVSFSTTISKCFCWLWSKSLAYPVRKLSHCDAVKSAAFREQRHVVTGRVSSLIQSHGILPLILIRVAMSLKSLYDAESFRYGVCFLVLRKKVSTKSL